MARTKISEFSSTPANNTDIDSINIAEGCAPSNINDAIRELMAQLKDFQIGSQGDSFNGPIGTTTAAAGAFTTLSASSTVTLSGGTANGVTYLNGSKVLTSGSALTFDGTTLGNSTSGTPLSLNRTGAGTALIELKQSGTVGSYLGTSGASDFIIFNGSAAELARFNGTGLGIGTSSPAAKLHVAGGAATQIRVASSVTQSNIAFYDAYDSGGFTRNWAIVSNKTAYGDLVFMQSSTQGGDPLAGDQRLYFNILGNVGIGTSSPATKLAVAGGISGTGAINISGGGWGVLPYVANSLVIDNNGGETRFFATGANATTDGSFLFYTSQTDGGANERARIDSSGTLLVGKTSVTNTDAGFSTSVNGTIIAHTNSSSFGQPLLLNRQDTDGDAIVFRRANGTVGSISVTGSATAYNTSSDYRLKNTTAPMTGALAKVALLKPCTYKWNVDGSDGEGFIAHELAEVVPQCVTGEKDAVDEEGNPKYQGIDTSFLVATLTAALQEAHGLIKSLEARVVALEAK